MDQLKADIQAWEASKDAVRVTHERRMQCKDIPDSLFLEAVRELTRGSEVTTAVQVRAALDVTIGPLPPNLFLAKARRLIAAGKLEGCGCGCRGDFQVPTAPRA